jgi:hypothetical protein
MGACERSSERRESSSKSSRSIKTGGRSDGDAPRLQGTLPRERPDHIALFCTIDRLASGLIVPPAQNDLHHSIAADVEHRGDAMGCGCAIGDAACRVVFLCERDGLHRTRRDLAHQHHGIVTSLRRRAGAPKPLTLISEKIRHFVRQRNRVGAGTYHDVAAWTQVRHGAGGLLRGRVNVDRRSVEVRN